MSFLSINNLSFITCPRIDKQNGWETIVFNPKTEEVFKINKKGYFLLKKIQETPGIPRQEIDNVKYSSFIQQMIEENVIIEKPL